MLSNINKILNDYSYEVKKSMRTKDIIVIKSKNRQETQKEIEKKLTGNKIPHIRQKNNALSGSIDTTVVNTLDKTLVLVFKPQSGGMSETTLNSTITELSPALAFANKFEPKNVDDFYNFLKTVNHEKSGVYVVDRDIEAGKKFINDYPNSSKFKEKMENAMGVLSYLYEEDKKRKIKNVYWGYRAKPEGVDNKHKGDLFIKYENGNMIGLSLKAGEEKSKEPKLNTYVNPILENINPNAISELRLALWDKIYRGFSADKSGYDKQGKKDTISRLSVFESNELQKYNELYDQGLEMIREVLTSSFEKNVKTTVDYLRSAIVGDAGDVPLVVLKAYSTSYKILTDEDDVSAFLPKVKTIKSYPSKTSKQDFYIHLKGNSSEDLILKFAVRTNKTGDEHKLGQFYNLAVKFTGIE